MQRRTLLFLGLLFGLAFGVGLEETLYYTVRQPEPCAPCQYGGAKLSYSQQGEDLLLFGVFGHLGLPLPTYLDIGAWDPVKSNNTYLFYRMGKRGVLVEPNPAFAKRLKLFRPHDTVINAGIGVSNQKSADYYIMRRGNGQLNTFSQSQVKLLQQKDPKALKRVIKMRLLNINDVIKKHFKSCPNLISLDVEGLDLAILKTLDFERCRPNVICVETLITGKKKSNTKLIKFLQSKGYKIRASTFVNSIFVDKKLLTR